ncbi:MAG: alpha/beta hydrolase [Cyanobacteria bacterium WB6_1B_304]|nr:alpha/beta hydrolase [Cyanobacteria bacterium WB6_1B_304]
MVQSLSRLRQRQPKGRTMPWLRYVLLGFLPTFLITMPANCAEQIVLTYGALQGSVKVADIEIFAREGIIQGDLSDYARLLQPWQREQFQRILTTRIDLGRVAVAQFLYSPQGETLLQWLGNIIQLPSGQSGFNAIRASIILGTDDREGLTLLNVLHKFPTQGIRIDLGRVFAVADELTRLLNQSRLAIDGLDRQARQEIIEDLPINYSQLPDLQLRGKFTWKVNYLALNDISRSRNYSARLYLPNIPSNFINGTTTLPVVVISHGFGSGQSTFAYLAEHLASYGFVVAIPEHPGSSSTQFKAFMAGRTAEVSSPKEFIDRPLDITFLLNQMEQWLKANPIPRANVNLKEVGVIGQSFGGYTALTLAGGTLNFPQLRKDCQSAMNPWNVSLLLQCIVLSLPPHDNSYGDPRVRAVIAINPVNRSVLGSKGLGNINIPVMIIGGGNDSTTPALLEQIEPFTWLTTPNRYLAIAPRGTHFSFLGDFPDSSTVTLPSGIVGTEPLVAQRYLSALSLAFFQVHIHRQIAYLPFLQSSYAQHISKETMPLFLVRRFSTHDLSSAILGINP